MNPWCVAWNQVVCMCACSDGTCLRCMSEFRATEPHQKPHHCCLQSSALYGTNILLLQIAFPLFDTPRNRSNYRSFPRHLLLLRGNLILRQENICAKVVPEHKQTAKHPFTFACQGNLRSTVHRQLPETDKKPLVMSWTAPLWQQNCQVGKLWNCHKSDIALKLDVSVEVMGPHIERQ